MINWLRTQYARFSDWRRKREADAIRKSFLDLHERIHKEDHNKFAQGMWVECEDCDGIGTFGPSRTQACYYCNGNGKIFRGL